MANQHAIQDGNQNFSLVGASGTAGTAETRRVIVNDAGQLSVDASVTVGDVTVGTISMISAGTISTLGTAIGVGTITNIGSISTIGTMPAISVGNASGGTLDLITRVSTIGTLEVGTISALPNIPGGTLGLITTVSNLSNGSINVTAGTVGGKGASGAAISGNPIPVGGTDAGGTVYTFLTDTAGHMKNDIVTGTVTMLSAGTVSMLNAGTITTLPNIPGGTLGLVTTVTNLSNGTIQNSGTTTGVGVVTSVTNLVSGTLLSSGTTTGVGIVSMLTAGTVSMLNAGTITTLPNIPGGTLGLVTTVTNLSNGTIQNSGTTTGVGVVSLLSAGTITKLEQGSINVTAGTVRADARPLQTILTYGTTFGGTAAGYGTLVAAQGSGTAIWVNDLSINNPTGIIRALVGFGTALQGTSVLVSGVYGTQTGIGIQKSYNKPVSAGMTNTDLVCYIGAAGTVDFNVSYFVSV